MALEDFDEADEELDIELEKLDLTATNEGIDPNDPLNEDLFDFPVMPAFAVVPETTSQEESDAVAPAEDAPPADAAPTTAEEEPAQAPSSPGAPNYDPDLDEDLFNFSEIFAGGDIVADAAGVTPEDTFIVPDTLVSPEPPVASSDPIPAPPVESDSPPAKSAPRRARTEREEHDLDEIDLSAELAAASAPIAVPVTAVSSGRDKLVLVLSICFLVVNTALILLAWQANSSFHATVKGVAEGIADGLSRQTQAAAPDVRLIPVPSTSGPPQEIDLRPSLLDVRPVRSIERARGMMAEGYYLDARRVLYHLLANRDMVPLTEELAIEAEYLVAQTYELQGKALAEAQR